MNRIEVDVLTGKKKTVPLTDGEVAELNERAQRDAPVRERASKVQAIAEVAAAITPRRLVDAILTPEGKQWLSDKETELAKLRVTL